MTPYVATSLDSDVVRLPWVGAADGRWNPFRGDSLEMKLAADAVANADISASVATTAGATLPSVSTIIHYDQVLGEASLSSSGGARFDIGSPARRTCGPNFESPISRTLSSTWSWSTRFAPLSHTDANWCAAPMKLLFVYPMNVMP